MPGIKWETVKVLNSPLSNAIYLGKMDKTNMFAVDRSTDRTEEIKSALMGHMDADTKEGCAGVQYTCEQGTLTWIKKGFKTRNDYADMLQKVRDILSMLNTAGMTHEAEHEIDELKLELEEFYKEAKGE